MPMHPDTGHAVQSLLKGIWITLHHVMPRKYPCSSARKKGDLKKEEG